MAQPKIFVSHSHQDNVYCRDFVAALRQGLGSDEAVWYDEHNLGWGKIRREIERELAQRQHFVAILSPAAVTSDWVNDEIDAAIDLLRSGSMQTIQFVVAVQCAMPLLLRNYKRVVAPGGQPYPAQEAARRALAVIQADPPDSAPEIPQSTVSQAAPPTYMQLNEQLFRQHAEYRRREQIVSPQPASLSPDRFPLRLAELGFTAHINKGVEYILPPLCDVPAGSFLVGHPEHGMRLPFYQIARYPVTVAEYACCVRAGHSEAVEWQKQQQCPDHPVVFVTWYDAVEYAAWLTELTGQPWRLPSEEEWEKAVRGTDGRVYPWGSDWDKDRYNTDHRHNINMIKATDPDITPIGTYPRGAGPYGTQDQVGNVREWTSSCYKDLKGSTDNRVVRGGFWELLCSARVQSYVVGAG